MEGEGELGLNVQQLEQLKEIKDIANVKYLQEKFKQLQSDFKLLQKERDEHLQTREQLKRRLDIVEDDVKKAVIEEKKVQHKLNSIMYQKCEDIKLENICLLLGFQLSKWHLLAPYQTDKKSCEKTPYSNNASQLLYEHDLEVTYDDLKNLVDDIQSNPPNSEYEKIQEFVKNSQDMAGLLQCLKQLIDA